MQSSRGIDVCEELRIPCAEEEFQLARLEMKPDETRYSNRMQRISQISKIRGRQISRFRNPAIIRCRAGGDYSRGNFTYCGPRGSSGDIKPRRDRKSVHFFTQRDSLLMRPTSRASIRLVAAARGISSDKRIV